MKIAIIGAGAMGTMFGAFLAKAGEEVCMIDVRKDHIDAINEKGLIVKTPEGGLPDRAFEEAGRLAAYYSKGKDAPKVEIDYIQKKHVKKPGGAKPGFVVYYTNYSLVAEPDISDLKLVES